MQEMLACAEQSKPFAVRFTEGPGTCILVGIAKFLGHAPVKNISDLYDSMTSPNLIALRSAGSFCQPNACPKISVPGRASQAHAR